MAPNACSVLPALDFLATPPYHEHDQLHLSSSLPGTLGEMPKTLLTSAMRTLTLLPLELLPMPNFFALDHSPPPSLTIASETLTSSSIWSGKDFALIDLLHPPFSVFRFRHCARSLHLRRFCSFDTASHCAPITASTTPFQTSLAFFVLIVAYSYNILCQSPLMLESNQTSNGVVKRLLADIDTNRC